MLTRLYDLLQKLFPLLLSLLFRGEWAPVMVYVFSCLILSCFLMWLLPSKIPFLLGIFAMHNYLGWDHQLIFPAALQSREETTAYCCQGWLHLHLGFTGESLQGKCWDQDGLFPTGMCQPSCPQQLGLNQLNSIFSLCHKRWWQLITSAQNEHIFCLISLLAVEKRT